MLKFPYMRVTRITTKKEKNNTTYSADFIFYYPIGGKKQKLLFILKWLYYVLCNPLQILKFDFSMQYRVWFTIPTLISSERDVNDTFFLIALPLAIALNTKLEFDSPISAELYKKCNTINEYFHEISKGPITVLVEKYKAKKEAINSVGLFFTLGVDSFYSLSCLKNSSKHNLKYLVYVDGFDVPFYQSKFLNRIHSNIFKVATNTNTQPLFIRTNLREVSDKIIGWGRYHATALVAIQKLTAIGKMHVSGESFEAPDWGLRFGVDKMYSGINHTVKLLGHGISRKKKIHDILRSPLKKCFLDYVRVCWENVRTSNIPYNCSNCQKCIKTQLTLQALEVKNVKTFLPIKYEKIRNLRLVQHVYPEWQELFTLLNKKADTDPKLLSVIAEVLKKPVRV